MMRFFILILLLSLASSLSAKNYYFSSNHGEDSRTSEQAQNPATPWRSIQKLNTIFSVLSPGDTVFFKSGEVFPGSINITKSGTSASPIVFTTYGNGPKAEISGMSALSGWTSVGNGIWEAAVNSSTPIINTLLIDGKFHEIGRYPNSSAANKGFMNFESSAGNSQITDQQLPASPNWTGGEVVIRKNRWVIDRNLITNHSGNAINYTSESGYWPDVNSGYFIQNHPSTLDITGEWYYRPSSRKIGIYFPSASPAGSVIEVSTTENLVSAYHQGYISLLNLSFKGANAHALDIRYSNSFRIINCDLKFSGINAINASNVTNCVIENNQISSSLNNGIISFGGNNITIKNNKITNTAVYPGLGKGGDGTYEAILLHGNNVLIEGNEIDRTGYIPITFNGYNVTVKNNYITNFTFVKDDGGGIYTQGSDPSNYASPERKVVGNIILNALGASEGSSDKTWKSSAHGIYLDDNSSGVEISSNTVANCEGSGLFVHNSHHNLVTNNTFYNNWAQILVSRDGNNPSPITHNTFTGNINFGVDPDLPVVRYESQYDDVANYGHFDNNYYARPANQTDVVRTVRRASNGAWFGNVVDIPGWTAIYGKDAYSKPAPKRYPRQSNFRDSIRFVYNHTSTAATFPLGANFIDVKNNQYNGTISLAPYASAVLLFTSVSSAPATKLDQTISFAPLANKTVGDAPFTVYATSSSGLPISFRVVSGPATISGTTITTTGSGTVTIEASQAGNNIYNPASTVLQNFSVIAPAPVLQNQTITFNALPVKTHGDAPFAINATTSSGLPVSFRIASGPATIAGNIVTITGTGTVSVEASQAGNTSFNPATTIVQSFQVVEPVQQSTCAGIGSILLEKWNDVAGITVANIPQTTAPASTAYLSTFEIASNTAENYATRIRGYICPPQTGNYTFGTSGDDATELWLSTNDDPANKKLIAYNLMWTPSREWSWYPSQKSASIHLIAGQKYYIEALHKEAAGGDNLAVYWQLPNGATESPIPGNRLSPFVVVAKPVVLQNQTIQFASLADRTFGDAPFSVSATASSGLPVSFRVVSGPASVAGNIVTLTGSGTVTIEASQSGNASYSAAKPVTQTFNISPLKSSSCSGTGSISYERWNNVSGSTLNNTSITKTTASVVSQLTLFEAPINASDNSLSRISGYLCPPQSGNYTFWIAGDDYCELWLSTNDIAINKRKIAEVRGYTMSREWSKYASQKSVQVYLESGRRYYIEALQKEGRADDNVAVAWQLPGGVLEAPIPGVRLSSNAPSSAGIAVVTSELKVVSGNTTTPKLAPIKDDEMIKVFPNPVRTVATINLMTGETGRISVDIVDMQGRVVKTVFSGILIQASTKTLELNVDRLTSGTYFVRLTTPSKVITRKIVIAK